MPFLRHLGWNRCDSLKCYDLLSALSFDDVDFFCVVNIFGSFSYECNANHCLFHYFMKFLSNFELLVNNQLVTNIYSCV